LFIFARLRLWRACFARAPFSAAADTSIVQLTLRPARSGGILMVCFGTADREGNSRTGGFPQDFAESRNATLQDGQSTFNAGVGAGVAFTAL
jgi:hypothetical protein